LQKVTNLKNNFNFKLDSENTQIESSARIIMENRREIQNREAKCPASRNKTKQMIQILELTRTLEYKQLHFIIEIII
jgi:hypothetical protein